MTRKTCLLLICMMLSRDFVCSGKLTQSEWGNPKVDVKQETSQWTIRGERLTVVVDPYTLAMQIRDKDVSWNIEGSTQGDLTIEHDGRNIPLCLKVAKEIKIEPYETGFMSGIKIQLNDYVHEDKLLKIRLQLNICLQTPNEDLVCELAATEDAAAVKQCLWPAPFEEASFDFTAVPFMQGMLLPKKWPERVWLYDTISYGRGLYMPWWGHQKDDSAVMVILETPADGGCRFSHPAGGPTKIGSCWGHSLGKLSYPRRGRLCFFRKGKYVKVSKRYRRYVMENG